MDGEDLGLIDGSGTEEEVLENEEQFVEGEEGGGDEGAEHEPAGDEGGEEGDQELEEGDRRPAPRTNLPLELRKALRANPEIAKQFPKLEKQLTGALFKATTVDRLGGVQKFREYAELLEAHGGPEGVQQAVEELNNWRALDQGFERGDPKILDGWVKDYPQGLKRLLGPAIERVEQMDLASHDQTLSVPMWKTLDRCGVISTIQALEGAISANKIEDVAKEFKLLKGFFLELRQMATKAKSPDPLAGDRQALDEERQGMAEEKKRTFYGTVRQDVNTQVTQRMNKLIRQELGATKIKLSVANRLRKAITAELASSVNSANGYAEKYNAVMSTNDRERAVRFISSAAFAKLPTVVRQLVAEFNLKRSAGNGTNGASAGRRASGTERSGRDRPSVIQGRPKTSEVDFTRTDKATWLATMHGHGQAWTTSGKLAKW